LKSLFPDKFNWSVYFLLIVLIKIIFNHVSWYSITAISISIYIFILLFDSIGSIIPTRHILAAFMCVQFFIGPTFAYNGLDEYQYFLYKMRIPESEYFSYAIPAVLLFIVGLNIHVHNNDGEKVDINKIAAFTKKNKSIAYIFIIIGLTASIFASFFSSELAFVFYLLGSFKFIGLFLIILGEEKLKILPLILVIGSIISSSLGSGMFHDLITWFVYIAAIFSIRYRLDYKFKLLGLIGFITLATVIQVLKSNYRSATGKNKEAAGVETFAKLYQKENEEKGVFSFANLAESNVRINQGFIITNIMNNVPDKVPYANGSELYILLEAAIMPRILAPNKLNAGDRTIFTKYSGIPLTEGTSMGLSTLGDAYLNFGVFGGVIFMFLLGLAYSQVLKFFQKKAHTYPILILFTAIVFYYPIRPDCETQTILGHLVKSCVLIYFIIQIWGNRFRVNIKQS